MIIPSPKSPIARLRDFRQHQHLLTSITHGTGNTVLTLTGTNFVPGVAALWNGSYRTTTIVDGTHVTMAIPASDLAADGSAMITLVNPGAPASAPLTFTVQ
jgi:hypothetical protein